MLHFQATAPMIALRALFTHRESERISTHSFDLCTLTVAPTMTPTVVRVGLHTVAKAQFEVSL